MISIKILKEYTAKIAEEERLAEAAKRAPQIDKKKPLFSERNLSFFSIPQSAYRVGGRIILAPSNSIEQAQLSTKRLTPFKDTDLVGKDRLEDIFKKYETRDKELLYDQKNRMIIIDDDDDEDVNALGI
jgi:hypothetical protein